LILAVGRSEVVVGLPLLVLVLVVVVTGFDVVVGAFVVVFVVVVIGFLVVVVVVVGVGPLLHWQRPLTLQGDHWYRVCFALTEQLSSLSGWMLPGTATHEPSQVEPQGWVGPGAVVVVVVVTGPVPVVGEAVVVVVVVVLPKLYSMHFWNPTETSLGSSKIEKPV